MAVNYLLRYGYVFQTCILVEITYHVFISLPQEKGIPFLDLQTIDSHKPSFIKCDRNLGLHPVKEMLEQLKGLMY